MKISCYIISLLLIATGLSAQRYYLRGEVKDESGNPLPLVTILNLRTGFVYKSGSSGSFGITTDQLVDSFRFSMDGYHTEKIAANANEYLSVQLKPAPATRISSPMNRLLSFTKGIAREEQKSWFAGNETYASIVENQFVQARSNPGTNLSLNIDRASYSNIRRFLTLGSQVPPDAVRIEEMLNYFNLHYDSPSGNNVFGLRSKLSSCPWNPANHLFFVDLSAKMINLDMLPPSHLVFLIDVSGSMDMANRLPLLKSAFRMLVQNLRARDSVSIVAYGGYTGVMLRAASGADKEIILKAIDELTPGGATPGESGINLAYQIAKRHFIHGGNNRVILATDGDFNVGLKTEEELDELISRNRESGIYLTCLGVGMGNYKDSKIQTLARKGNGNFSYLDSYEEAQKVLLKEFTQTLYAVADDAFMHVEFNPRYVKRYRLIGFENKVGALRDSLATVEGGEIGSGYSMMGLFEIEPVKSDTVIIERFAEVSVHYKLPQDTAIRVFTQYCMHDFEEFHDLAQSYRFAATVATFGGLLRQSAFIKNTGWNDMVMLAAANADANSILQKEFVNLVELARNQYTKGRKKRR